jgi:hypothetical protein
MAEYTDVPDINTLYIENEQVNTAIGLLQGTGTMLFFTIGETPASGSTPQMWMGTRINSYPPAIDATLTQSILNYLTQKSSDIQTQLANLGVVNPAPPPSGATGATGATGSIGPTGTVGASGAGATGASVRGA